MKSPRSSNSLYGLSVALAARIRVSVRKATKSGVGKILDRPYPRFLPSSKEGCPQTRLTTDRQFYTLKQSVTVRDGTRRDGVGLDGSGEYRTHSSSSRESQSDQGPRL